MNSLTKRDQKALKLILAYVQLTTFFDNNEPMNSQNYEMPKKNMTINQNDNDKSLEEILQSMWVSKDKLRVKEEDANQQINNNFYKENINNINQSLFQEQQEINNESLMNKNENTLSRVQIRIKQEREAKTNHFQNQSQNQKSSYKQKLKLRSKWFCKECDKGYVQEYRYKKHIRLFHQSENQE